RIRTLRHKTDLLVLVAIYAGIVCFTRQFVYYEQEDEEEEEDEEIEYRKIGLPAYIIVVVLGGFLLFTVVTGLRRFMTKSLRVVIEIRQKIAKREDIELPGSTILKMSTKEDEQERYVHDPVAHDFRNFEICFTFPGCMSLLLLLFFAILPLAMECAHIFRSSEDGIDFEFRRFVNKQLLAQVTLVKKLSKLWVIKEVV
ncbi:hypothetical protein PENTCL1PPCAC_29345, partial [Pristionchus entomophagus]